MAVIKGGLGKGLDAIFNENATENDKLITVKLTEIEPNRGQPRKDFKEELIEELAESIKEHGLLQPIIVKPTANGRYKIIAGERRWRACRKAGLEAVPVIVKDYTEQEIMEVALIENLQREGLNPIEEAEGYKQLIDSYGLTQEQVAVRVGKSRAAVANALRLLTLGEQARELLQSGAITAGHARAILSAGEDENLRRELIEMAKEGKSVRELENAIKVAKKHRKPTKTAATQNKFYAEVELALTQAMHRKVKVKKTVGEQGILSIEFLKPEELKEMADRLAGKNK